jgi:tetratricopeptide (TPR) repeat protein
MALRAAYRFDGRFVKILPKEGPVLERIYPYMHDIRSAGGDVRKRACYAGFFAISKGRVEHNFLSMLLRILNWATVCALFLGISHAEGAQGPARKTAVIVLETAGKVEFLPAGSANWYICITNQQLHPGDQLRTGPNSRAAVRLSDLTVFRVGSQGYLRIRPEEKKRSAMDLLKGLFYFFHRDSPGEFDFQTPTVSAVVRGTEFNVEVVEDGPTTITVLDGHVEMTNSFGAVELTNREQGRAEPGKAPAKTAVLDTTSVIQWLLYYPGVLDADEPGLSATEQEALKDSLAAYRSGDLLAALAKYPADRTPVSSREQIYLKALKLSVGQVEDRKVNVTNGDTETRALDVALDKVIATVQSRTRPDLPKTRDPVLATEWMAESIYQQSQHDLAAALVAAKNASAKSPRFGFAWERVAELEFSFGRISNAKAALQRSLDLSPRNAQALALMGFLLAAENRTREAITWFDRAIAVDGALGNAWLGRGLCRIRKGDAEAGREDIQVAATVEPQRAAFRSYLGKAFSHMGDDRRATNELALAMQLDPNDPTAWLYLALIEQQQNRINEAVKDFEHAQDLSTNRAVYRSRLLLDQDRAVGGVNLATIYEDAGMTDVSVREATRAVTADYSIYSSHLFLANSYNALRDPGLVNLRYETPAVSEYLVANLLAPVGAGILSPHVTQQEYSKLFERDRLGFSSTTEYLSRGDWYQAASQFGTFGNSSYAVDFEYRSENGQRPNNDLEQVLGSIKFKQQLTAKDDVFVQGVYSYTRSGDLRQFYDFNNTNIFHGRLRVKETQEPIALLGYHHEWNPGSHTLFLGGRLQDTLEVNDPDQFVPLFARNTNGQVGLVSAAMVVGGPAATNFHYKSEFDAYSGELQQIWKPGDLTFIVGSRLQAGTFDTRTSLRSPPTRLAASNFVTFVEFEGPSTNSHRFEEDFDRITGYAYANWQVFDSLLLSAGITYDRLEFPQNFRYSPLSTGQERKDQVSPKGGFIWTPLPDTTVRAAYTRSLAGVSFDQSFQLEPSQVAGFNQMYRSLIPESVAGAIAGAEFETWGVSVDQKFKTGTYLGAQAEWLNSEARRGIGVIQFTNASFFDPNYDFRIRRQFNTPETLDYEERTLLFTFNQLVGDNFSFGARYRWSEATLQRDLVEIPRVVAPGAHSDVKAILHQVNLFALAYHPSGLFGQVDTIWSQQSNQGYNPDIPGDDFWQVNLFVGYRFPRRRAEVRFGVLNITDQNYRLNPLNLTADLPRDRTLLASLRFHF